MDDDFIILQKKNKNKKIDIDLFFLFLEPNKTKQNQYNDIRITHRNVIIIIMLTFISLNNIYENHRTRLLLYILL